MTQPVEPTNTPKSKVSYSFNPETREIIRADLNGPRVLAVLLESKKIEYVDQDARKMHPAVVRFLNEEQIEFDGTTIKGTAPDALVDIPPPPKKSLRFGDKTPEYVEWMKKYKPNEYAAHYGIRGIGTVTKVREEINPVNGRPRKVKYKVDGVTLARRKTHLTELPDADDMQEDES